MFSTFQEDEERPRPEFAAKAPFLEKNPITGIKEPSFPKTLRLKRIAAGAGLILFMISLVFIFIFSVILYRQFKRYEQYKSRGLSDLTQNGTQIDTIFGLIFLPILVV